MQVVQSDPKLSTQLNTQYDPSLLRSLQESLRTGTASTPAKVDDDAPRAPEIELSHGGRLLNALAGRGDLGESLMKLMKHALELVTGKKVENVTVDQQSLSAGSITLDEADSTLVTQTGQNTAALDYQYHSLHAEARQLDFAASGTLKLKDGSSGAFSFSLSISQVFVQDTSASLHLTGDVTPKAEGTHPATTTRLPGGGWHFALDGAGLSQLLPALEHDDDDEHGDDEHAAPAPSPTAAGSGTPTPVVTDPVNVAPASTLPATTAPAPSVPSALPGTATAPAVHTEIVFSQQFRAFLSGTAFYQSAANGSPFQPTINLAA